MTGSNGLPVLLTADETADLLRTSRAAIYAMTERGQLSARPGSAAAYSSGVTRC
ncbi:MAG: helix-turn-helix domain-containing protein [Acidobacteria bacterium]|nr:helix-turn-helix domain-containing protein [Acidobacteriota bacterium]